MDEVASAFAKASQSTERAAVAAARRAVEQNAAKAAAAASKLAAEEMGGVVAKLDASESLREQAEGKVRQYLEQLERTMGARLRSVAVMVEQRDTVPALPVCWSHHGL